MVFCAHIVCWVTWGVWFSEAVNGVAAHAADLIWSDMEAYANLLTVVHTLSVLEERYRTARI